MQSEAAGLDANDAALRREAGELLEDTGLLRLLAEYGKPHLMGSYALRLMVWRALDLTLEAGDISAPAFFELGRRIVLALDPANMSFRNTRLAPTEGLPDGLYWAYTRTAGARMPGRSTSGPWTRWSA